jgi:choline dehydrogenase-like flavoprotein
MTFTNKHHDLLVAIADTFVQGFDRNYDDYELNAFWQRKASDLKVAEAILSVMLGMPEEVQAEFRQALELFDSRLFLGLLTGKFTPFPQLSIQEREEVLQKLTNHPLAICRQLVGVFKKLSTFLYYGTSPNGADNPNWKILNYNRPTGSPSAVPVLPTLSIAKDTELSCEILVIGSGAGGGVIAGELAAAGKDVLIVDKGLYIPENQFNHREVETVLATHDAQGLLVSKDGGVAILAGSLLGGGTTINWTGSLRTPDYVLQEWAEEANLPFLVSKEYQKCFEAIEQATHVGTDESVHNAQNQILWDGAKKLAHKLKVIPRNTDGCAAHDTKECGFCTLGCRHGYKKNRNRAFLEKAVAQGTRILVNTHIERLLIENGTVVGAEGYHNDFSGQLKAVKIKAKKVVVAAGAIQTPALLLRSGLRHSAIGENLYLHPTVVVSAQYKHKVHSWEGVMMSALDDQFARLTGNFGFKIETPPVHAGLFALGMPWTSAKAHKEFVLSMPHVAHFIILTRDKFGGKVKINKAGRPEIYYRLHEFDKKHVLRGIEEGAKIHHAAQAEKIYLPHHTLPSFTQNNLAQDLPKAMQQLKWTDFRFNVFSAHQMGTCRMGGNRQTHAISPAGESYDVRNLYVADGSIFPRCSGANPMLSIQALAYWVAQGLK